MFSFELFEELGAVNWVVPFLKSISLHPPCYQRDEKGSDHGRSACLGVAHCTGHESA